MALKVSQIDVWVGSIQDRPGGLNDKLAALAQGGVNLEFIMARRAPDQPGKGVVFLTPIKGARQAKAAAAAGFRKTGSVGKSALTAFSYSRICSGDNPRRSDKHQPGRSTDGITTDARSI